MASPPNPQAVRTRQSRVSSDVIDKYRRRMGVDFTNIAALLGYSGSAVNAWHNEGTMPKAAALVLHNALLALPPEDEPEQKKPQEEKPIEAAPAPAPLPQAAPRGKVFMVTVPEDEVAFFQKTCERSGYKIKEVEF